MSTFHDEYATVKEAAAILGVKPGTLAQWRWSGRDGAPAYYRILNRVYYKRTDLNAWLERNTQPRTHTLPGDKSGEAAR